MWVGQAILMSYFPLAGSPSMGVYISLLLIALAGLSFSICMMSSDRAAAIVGLLVDGCDLIYCLTLHFSLTLQIILM